MTTRITCLTASSLVLIYGLTASSVARGTVESDLTNYVNSVGGINVTSPSVFRGQSRGYINGGRLFARIPQRTVTPVSIRAPRFTAGCGGIDAFGGALSFLSAAEIVNTLRSIGTAAGSYALMLGLRTISSQIANTIEKNFDWLMNKTGGDINSCESAASLLGGLGQAMGFNNQEQNVCIIQTMEATGSDYTEAKRTCTTSGGSKTNTNNTRSKELAFIDGNLTWMVLERSQLFTTDNDMKRMAMSITGTIVKRQVRDVGGTETTVGGDINSQTKSEVYPSLMLTQQQLLDVMLYGGTMDRYDCNDTMTGIDGCREVVISNRTLAANDALVPRTRVALMSLYNAIRNRTDPATSDVDYVAETRIPTMRIVRTAALLDDTGLGVQIIDDYAEQIAIELLATYISGIIGGISAHSFDAAYGDESSSLREGIELVQKEINRIRDNAEISVNRSLQIAEQMEHYERILISAMPVNITRSLAWASR